MAFVKYSSVRYGSCPWTHVIFQFLLPHGECAFGHVMEFIDGFRAEDRDAASLGLNETRIFHLVRKVDISIYGM
jgi:hypothetical protein